jgi:predicted dehydrogenase
MKKIRVAVIGLGFGAEFVPIYQKCNNAECVAICRRSVEELNECGDRFGIDKRYTDYYELLKDDKIDAVHINTSLKDHAWMAIEALKAGKHVASTVPMGLTIDECLKIVELEKNTGKVYMMMETAVYTREYIYVKNLFKKGEIGRIQFMRGSHQQNMGLPGWKDYWYGLPPMYYATHALSPLSAMINKKFKTVRCLGSGRIQEEYVSNYGSPFAVETAQLTFENSDIVCEATRSLFNTIRQYRESFDIYGSKKSFEWEQVAGENPVIFSGYEDAHRIEIPDTDQILPKEISNFTLKNKIVDKNHVSYIQGAGHGGSHPHMVHEFISAICQGRKAFIDSSLAANWTISGILAHDSALQGGTIIEIPKT